MTEMQLDDLIQLIEMKNNSPEEYKQFLKDAKEVYKDMLKMLQELQSEMRT